MLTGLGDITTFSNSFTDWLLLPFSAASSIGSSAINSVNSYMQPVTNTGNQFISTLTGYNVAPVLDANVAFANVPNVTIAPPVVDSSGNLQMSPLDLTSAINQGFTNAANYQILQGSDYNGTGTPSASSSIGLWILLGVGGFLILEALKKY